MFFIEKVLVYPSSFPIVNFRKNISVFKKTKRTKLTKRKKVSKENVTFKGFPLVLNSKLILCRKPRIRVNSATSWI